MDIAFGVVGVLVSIPLALRKIAPNALYGFRISPAFRSEEDWYDINAFGGRQLIYWSCAIIASGLIKLLAPMEDVDDNILGWLILFGPIVIGSLIPIVTTIVYATIRTPDPPQQDPIIPDHKLKTQRKIVYITLVTAAAAVLITGALTTGIRLVEIILAAFFLALVATDWLFRITNNRQ
jgi:hypothetical protein